MPFSEVEQIEREIEQTRGRLNATLDSLQNRATIVGIAEEAAGALEGTTAHRAGLKALDIVRANPIPSAIAIIGLSWLARQYFLQDNSEPTRRFTEESDLTNPSRQELHPSVRQDGRGAAVQPPRRAMSPQASSEQAAHVASSC